MKSVICVYNMVNSTRLTYGKIYEVLEIVSQGPGLSTNIIFIKDDIGDESSYVLKSGNLVWFEDATPYIREEKLKKLGI